MSESDPPGDRGRSGGAAPVEGGSGTRRGPRSTWLRGGRGILGRAGAAYLAFLPLGSLLIIPVGDTHATGADLLLLGLLLVGALTVWRSPGFRGTMARSIATGARLLGRAGGGSPGAGAGIAAALVLLIGYGAWAALSGAWGYHPVYSVAKGSGYLALAVGAAAIVWSGLEWDEALDAWLLGAGLTVAMSLALASVAMLMGGSVGAGDAMAGTVAAGAAARPGGAASGGLLRWTNRMLYEGGSLMGLPGRRLRGPFLHPNGLGDYLTVTGAILWARWPALRASGSAAATPRLPSWILWSGASMLVLALGLTLSSAWVAVGVLLLIWGRRTGSLAVRGLGGIVAATTFAALVFPLRLGFGPVQVTTSGIRPMIWEDAMRAFFTNPLIGVGAAPVLADAVDPVDPESGLRLWDAHNAYLSVLGQFGLVGFLLVAGAAFLIVRSLFRARERGSARVTRGHREAAVAGPLLLERARRGVLAALLAIGVHGLVIAGEDFRHWWALVALAGLAVGGAWDWNPGRDEWSGSGSDVSRGGATEGPP